MSYKKITLIVCSLLIVITTVVNIIIFVNRPEKTEYVYIEGSQGPVYPTPESAVEAYYHDYVVPVLLGINSPRYLDLSVAKDLCMTPEMSDAVHQYMEYLRTQGSMVHKFPWHPDSPLYYGNEYEFNILLIMQKFGLWDTRLDPNSQEYLFDNFFIYLTAHKIRYRLPVQQTVSAVGGFEITYVLDEKDLDNLDVMPDGKGSTVKIEDLTEMKRYNQFMRTQGMDQCCLPEPDEWKYVEYNYYYIENGTKRLVEEFTLTFRYGDEWYVYILESLYSNACAYQGH